MSRAGNLVGVFETVDYSTAKDGRRPWTSEDAARLAGTFKLGGRATKPHVMTPAGPYVVGIVPEPRPQACAGTAEVTCRHCGRAKIVTKPFAIVGDDGSVARAEGPWCFGCGMGA